MRNKIVEQKKVIMYVLIVGTALGVISVFSDIIPYQLESRSIFEIALFVLGGVMNNLAIWFLLSMILGYKFCNSLKWSAIMGASFAVYAIILYFVFSYLITMHEQPTFDWSVFFIWIVASIIGGAIGSTIGFLAQRYNILWGIPIAFIVVQLVRYGERIWKQPISIATNIVLLAVASGILFFSISKVLKKR